MKYISWVLLACSLYSVNVNAFEVPHGFEASEGSDEHSKLWLNSDTLETVNVSDEDVSDLKPAKDALTDVLKTLDAQAFALTTVLNIKDWKVTGSNSDHGKDGSQLIWIFGSYKDSSDEMTYFAEVYSLSSDGKKNIGYLFTRPDSAWTQKDISDRFKVAVQ